MAMHSPTDGRVPLQSDRKKQLIEVTVFLFLIIPSIAISLFVSRQAGLTFPIVAVSTILRDLSLLSLILYFLWSNDEPILRVGLASYKIQREVFMGIILYIPFFLGIALFQSILFQLGLSLPSRSLTSFLAPQGVGEYLLAFILVIVVAVSEEVIFRGYLILRLANTSGNVLLAAAISSLIFALGHGYEGSAGILTVGIMGFLFALVYLWRMSLVAPIVMHFLQDFIGIILMPLLGY